MNYRAPQVKKGDIIHDEWLGDVTVDGFTDAPIQWPATLHQGKLMPILFDGLVRAIIEEPEVDVARAWRVSKYHVDVWKKAVAGGGTSSEVFARLALKKHDPDFRKKFY